VAAGTERSFRLLKVISDRIKELESQQQLESTNDTDSTATKTSEPTDEDSNIYIGSKRRRLAFVDMLLSEKSLTPDDVQEEVDTFMFEVRLQFVLTADV
jgi:hypothetical protein